MVPVLLSCVQLLARASQQLLSRVVPEHGYQGIVDHHDGVVHAGADKAVQHVVDGFLKLALLFAQRLGVGFQQGGAAVALDGQSGQLRELAHDVEVQVVRRHGLAVAHRERSQHHAGLAHDGLRPTGANAGSLCQALQRLPCRV